MESVWEESQSILIFTLHNFSTPLILSYISTSPFQHDTDFLAWMASCIVLKGTSTPERSRPSPCTAGFPNSLMGGRVTWDMHGSTVDERRALYLPSAQSHYHSLELSTFTTATRPQNQAIPFASADPMCTSLVKQLGQWAGTVKRSPC